MKQSTRATGALRKALATAVACVLAAGALLTAPAANAADAPQTVAGWAITANPSAAPAQASIAADSGIAAGTAALTTNATGKAWGTSATYFLATSGWDGDAGAKYWQAALPAGSDYTNMSVSAQFRASSTTTKNWKVQSSTDGKTFADVTGGTFTIGTTSGKPGSVAFGSQASGAALSLPDGTVAVRFSPADSASQSGGTCYINNIVITGTPAATQIGAVTATPSSQPSNGYVAKGTTVQLACTTAGASIYYQLNATGDDYTTGKTAYTGAVTVNETTSIRAWAELNGQKGDVSTFTYSVDAGTGSGGTDGGSDSGVSTIADTRAEGGKGGTFTVKGTALTDYLSSASALGVYIQDSTGGIMLYGSTVLKAAGIKAGDVVKATGATSLYNGKYELVVTSAEIVSQGSVPGAKTIAAGDAGETAGGMLVHLDNAAVSDLATDSYSNVTFTMTQNDKTLSAKYDSRRGSADAATLAAALKDAKQADVTGILEGYNGSYTLQIRSAADVSDIQTSTGGGTGGGTQEQVGTVTASPGSGASVAVGSAITLTPATDGASIKYKIGDDASYSDYTGAVTVQSLPMTLTAYAVKDGMKDGEVSTFTYSAPFTGTYNVYFGQLHSHTTLSDGVGTVDEAFSHASNVKNLDFLAVTDHSNYFESSSDAQAHKNTILDGSSSTSWLTGRSAASAITAQKIKTGNKTDSTATFLGIYGYEMTWSDGSGHINTFNTNGFEDRQNPTYRNNSQSASNPSGLKAYYDTLTEVSQSSSQFNHPGTTFGDFYDFTNYSPTYDNLINMIEVGNGEGAIRSSGYFPSYEYYTRALDKGWHVAPTNNQDNHKGNWGDSNTARTVILAPELTEQSLYDAMKAHRIYATEDNDLSIYYTLNGSIMGSELSLAKSGTVHIEAKLSDPTDTSLGKVEVIVNGGRVAASKTIDTNTADVTFDLPNSYSYYYLRVTEADKDIAVTAPVWTDEVDKAGIASTTADTTLPVKGEALSVTSSLYNNESTPMTVESLTYKLGDTVLKTVSGGELTGGASIASLGTNSYSFSYTPASAGDQSISVTLVVSQGGTEKTYTGTLALSVADPNAVTRVVIDGTHNNDYVTGYYAHNMNNFTQIAADDGTQVKVVTDAITPEILQNTQLLVISAPAKSSGTAKDGTAYTAQTFSDEFIAMVKNYVQSGGHVVICGLSDYTDGSAPYTAAAQINKLLEGIGATARIRSDELMDDDSNGGQNYRLYLQNFNTASSLFSGVVSGQEYSAYSGCSVDPGSGTWLVKGYATTYAEVSHGAGKGAVSVQKGDVVALSEEDVGKGQVVTSGTVFLSDFEVKATLDNYGDLQYANYNIAKKLLDAAKVTIPATKIADVRKNGQAGDVYAVEGTVTAGSEQPNAFTDTVYIQDETGGINIYPLANGSGIKLGQKVRVVGHVDAYQGDKELKIGSGVEGYEVLDTAVNTVQPTSLTVAEAADYGANGGLLAAVTGTVSDIRQTNGMLESFTVKDGTNTGGIRILINGYITPDVDVSGIVTEGARVSVTGLVYTDPDGVCLRVRDRGELTKAAAGGDGAQNVSVSAPKSTDGAPEASVPADVLEKVKTAVMALLTDDEKQAVLSGRALTVTPTLGPIASPSADDVQQITALLARGNLTDTSTIAQYIDISLLAQVGTGTARNITELDAASALTITIAIPSGLQKAGRVFRIVRVHDGAAQLLADQDNDPSTVTIVTDKFSTYALVYTDPVQDSGTPTVTETSYTTGSSSVSTETDAQVNNPNTGYTGSTGNASSVTFLSPLFAGPIARRRKARQ